MGLANNQERWTTATHFWMHGADCCVLKFVPSRRMKDGDVGETGIVAIVKVNRLRWHWSFSTQVEPQQNWSVVIQTSATVLCGLEKDASTASSMIWRGRPLTNIMLDASSR